jgi:DNA-binding NarL/FixJ family response regulator
MASAAQARVMILTASNDLDLQRRAVLLGALGVVQKREAGEVLIKAIENVYAGQVWLDKSIMMGVLADLSRSDGDKKHGAESGRIGMLTKREREVITLVGEGLRNKQIADKLFISETTVRHHITSIFNKLGVSNRLNLVMYAYQHGLAKPPY